MPRRDLGSRQPPDPRDGLYRECRGGRTGPSRSVTRSASAGRVWRRGSRRAAGSRSKGTGRTTSPSGSGRASLQPRDHHPAKSRAPGCGDLQGAVSSRAAREGWACRGPGPRTQAPQPLLLSRSEQDVANCCGIPALAALGGRNSGFVQLIGDRSQREPATARPRNATDDRLRDRRRPTQPNAARLLRRERLPRSTQVMVKTPFIPCAA